MAKLVILSEGMTGRSHELNVDKTTIGRVEGNTFPIIDPSVSSHHCEILLRGGDVVVRDLNSTNGTYINGEKITEAVLKPGQMLRLGQVELRLETGVPAEAPKKAIDSTMAMPRGVSRTDLEQGVRGGFDTAVGGFAKKDNQGNKIFLIGAIVVGAVIVGLLIYAFVFAKSSGN
ncbi:MAG: FHA domain-containing protein [Verrucomicrobia bacterium]|jgi:pSer/pThr/pTyr-binding forkhead associated (FHA) protein|nr:FHA domain-containing protein [Verrucomicrobiota bacterium]